MQRRDFLQMLGAGAATLVGAPTAAASPIVPLFSGQESKIWTPEHANLTRSHVVLTRPPQTPWQIAPTPLGADPTVSRVVRKKYPAAGGRTLSMFDDVDLHVGQGLFGSNMIPNVPQIPVEFEEGHDPHHAFYQAAMKMRNNFATQSQQRLLEIEQWKRPHTTLVTLVDTDIFAGIHSTGPNTEGYHLEISYTPHVIDAADGLELNGWDIYSENGEYPIEVPTNIDIDFLMRVDVDLVTGKLNPLQLGRRILVP